MKIIKQGNIDLTLNIKRFECRHCKCIFDANKNEYTSASQYNETYYMAECPCCKKVAYDMKEK